MARILSIGPHPEILAARNRALAQSGHDVRGAATRLDALAAAKSARFDLVLLCSEFPPGYASELASRLRQFMPRTPILFAPEGEVTATISELEDMVREQLRPKAA